VESRDKFGNRLSTGGCNVGWFSDRDATPAKANDNLDGTYTIVARFVEAGVHDIHVVVNGVTKTKLESITVHPSNSFPPNCTAEIPHSVCCDEPGRFLLKTVDAYGNERRTGGDRVHVEIRGPTKVLASVTDCGDGTYAVSYTCCASGSYQVHVSVNGAAIAPSPFEMNVTAAASSAQHCLVQWTDVQSAVAGEAFSFKVEARDRFLNKRRVGGDAFRVQCSQRMETATTDHGDGSYTVSCTLFEAGSNVCFVMLGEDAVGTEGFRADVSAAAVDVASCRVLGEGLKGARAGEEADVVVVLSDKYGNLRAASETVKLRMILSTEPSAVALELCGMYNQQLRGYLMQYRTPKAGTYDLKVYVGESKLIGYTSTVSIVPAVRDPLKSFVVPGNLECGPHIVGDPIEYTVQTADTFGNHMQTSGGQLTCSFVSNGRSSAGSVSDNGDGTYSCR
jgi:hypothetical protein